MRLTGAAPDATARRQFPSMCCRAGAGYDALPMPPPFAFTGPHRSRAFGRERDAQVCWLLEMHPVTAAMLVRIGWFPTKKKALQRLSHLVERRRIKLVGTVCRKAGRPENVYGRWSPKPDHLLHEVQLTEFCFRLDAEGILRGPHATDTDIRPDAEARINGEVVYIEWDRGTMSYGQIVRQRFSKYEWCRHLVLWVCPTVTRREGLRTRAERIRSVALFATADDALASPHRAIWLDYQGGTAHLPRHGENQRGELPGATHEENA